MRKRTRLRLAVPVVAVGLGIGACGGAPADGLEVLNIGYSGPLSGGAAFYGRNVQLGLQTAAEEINERGGLEVDGRRYRVNIASLDDHYLPNETATNSRRLVQQSRAAVIFVPHAGGIRAVQGLNTRDGTRFLLMAYSSEPSVLEARNPLTVMIPPRFDNYAEPFVSVMMERFGPRLGVLPTTTPYGRAWMEVITDEWRKQGGQVGRNYGVDYNTTTDFTGVVTQVLAERPDVLFVGGPSQPTGLVIRAAREQGFRGGTLMMDQPKFEELLDVVSLRDLEGTVGVHPQETYPAPGIDKFVGFFRERHGPNRVLVSEIALNYQALHIVTRAMELAGTTSDPEAIRARIAEAAASLPLEHRVSQIHRTTELGHFEREVYGAAVVDGEFVALPIPHRH